MKRVYIIAGPNGSGKTTIAKELVEEFKLPFLNADELALTLAKGGDFRKIRLSAGKLFFKKLDEYIKNEQSFIVETTLAGKYFVRLINILKKQQYEIILIFVFVESSAQAINRIKLRERKGGHSVPKEDIIRRFGRSMKNFWNIYRNLVDLWKLMFNGEDEFQVVAFGKRDSYDIMDNQLFKNFLENVRN